MSLGDAPDATRRAGESLCLAAWVGDVQGVEAILARGVDLGAPTAEGELSVGGAALVNALRSGSSSADAIALLLLARGADPNARGPLGVTPLMLAASTGKWSVIEALLERGVEIAAVDEHGQNALHHARAALRVDVMLGLCRVLRDRHPDRSLDALCASSPIEQRHRLPAALARGSFVAIACDGSGAVLARADSERECLQGLWRGLGMPRPRTGPYLAGEVLADDPSSEGSAFPLSEADGEQIVLAEGARVIVRELPPVSFGLEPDARGCARITILGVTSEAPGGAERAVPGADAGRRLHLRVASLWYQDDGYDERQGTARVPVGRFA